MPEYRRLLFECVQRGIGGATVEAASRRMLWRELLQWADHRDRNIRTEQEAISRGKQIIRW